jgi:hypothetical protein
MPSLIYYLIGMYYIQIFQIVFFINLGTSVLSAGACWAACTLQLWNVF